jgi:hypothetical protein
MKAEAMAAFAALAVDWPDGLLDEQTRIGALQSDIAGAERAYAEAEAAEQKGELALALDLFKTAQTYYARYRDVAARVERLTKTLAERGDGG